MPRTKATGCGRVLCLTSNFPRWEGDSTTPFVLHLAQDLMELGWQVDVLAPHAPGCATREILGGVPVERFRYLWPGSLETVCYQGGALLNLRRNRSNFAKLPALVLCEWAAVMRRLASRHYDLLHSHWILPQGFTGALAARPLGVPHVITVHGGDAFALRGALLARFKRFALTHAEAVTVNSSATRAAILDTAALDTTLHTIPMGVTEKVPDPQAVAQIRERYRRGAGPLLVFIGRLVYEKGADDLVAAIDLLRDRLPDARALVIGDGPDKEALQNAVARQGLEDHVIFTGWVQPDEVPNYLAAADIFVGPSKTAPDGWVEAQGLTFAEAMLAGTPVIATRSGGIVDAVRHDETGLLVDEGAPEQIAAAVVRLAETTELRTRLGRQGRKLARSGFTRSASATSFGQLFGSLLTINQRRKVNAL